MKTAYVVLGMHRSGTSSVAGTLSLLGASAPRNLMGPKPDNPSGFWESEKIAEFNDEIFHAAGSSWLDWGPLDPAVFEGPHGAHIHGAARWLLGSEFRGAETIVLKDPRICRLYPFWRSALEDQGYRPLVISPIRSPDEVAASLFFRDRIRRPLALKLWLHHVLEAERTSRGQARHFMIWPDFIADWRGQVARMAETFERPSLIASIDGAAVDAFLNPDLHRQKLNAETDAASEYTPDLIPRAYAALSDLAIEGESAKSHKALDRVRDDLREAMRFFYDGPGPI
ncbi:hypothetical protein [Brevundimonas sp. NIBR11]|uniref:sulfotransferase family protein n=1 Tax=Brevundimonas sp. NIBR11 TaxID=3015999 RepID=UPI0022F00C48|nr:hypothetical protein [Brevundimonas sp. NIBR11]WGM32292.1 hypothetical protein KKHFBJBL_02543 [Brevundimonas sp. NIBR11]